jgi:hypothetical protein
LNNVFINNKAFATYENEKMRGDLVANGNMGFVPDYPLCNDAINYILDTTNLEPGAVFPMPTLPAPSIRILSLVIAAASFWPPMPTPNARYSVPQAPVE